MFCNLYSHRSFNQNTNKKELSKTFINFTFIASLSQASATDLVFQLGSVSVPGAVNTHTSFYEMYISIFWLCNINCLNNHYCVVHSVPRRLLSQLLCQSTCSAPGQASQALLFRNGPMKQTYEWAQEHCRVCVYERKAFVNYNNYKRRERRRIWTMTMDNSRITTVYRMSFGI